MTGGFVTGGATTAGFNVVSGFEPVDIDIDRVPDFFVNRTAGIVTMNVREQKNTPVTIFKAVDAKANFVKLTQQLEFPWQESESREVKYKTAYSFTGLFDGEEVDIIGQRSQSVNVAKEDE